MRTRLAWHQRGFTLIEMVMVIVITGILGVMVAVFIKTPIEGYFDSARRAELSDAADTAARRMARDMRLALPNSIRHPSDGSDQCIEFIPTRIGGRYRAAAGTGGGDMLDFTAADSSFDMLWLNSALPAADQIAVGDLIAVYNDGSADSNAYEADNTSPVTALVEDATAKTTNITMTAKQFPADSPTHRFQVIPGGERVVGYGCSAGTLYRYSSASMHAQPASCAALASGATAAILANDVDCAGTSLHYAGSDLQQQGLVSVSLKLVKDGESVNLYHQVHLDNTP
jgi:MSHA biogenesis protein MshO